MRARWKAGLFAVCGVLALLTWALPSTADTYYPRTYTDRVTGLSGTLKPDLSGRLGGSMPVTPDLQRLPVAHACGICRAECREKWQFGCHGNGCMQALAACVQACWWNDCRGGR